MPQETVKSVYRTPIGYEFLVRQAHIYDMARGKIACNLDGTFDLSVNLDYIAHGSGDRICRALAS